MTDDPYPEHTKLRPLRRSSQDCADFYDWLHEQGYAICKRDGERWWPTQVSKEKLLAAYFDIDLKRLDAEKEAMLEEIRQHHAAPC